MKPYLKLFFSVTIFLAVGLLWPVLAAEPPTENSHFLVAQQAYINGDYDTAQFEFSAVLSDTTATPDEQRQALHWLGRSELLLGNALTATVTLALFSQQYPHDSLSRTTQFNLGMAYQQTKEFTAAVKAYKNSLRPNDLINDYIYEQIGDVNGQAGAYAESITAYQNSLKLAHDDNFQTNLHEKIATIELQRDNPRGAIEQYQAILNLTKTPSYRAKILKLLGEAYMTTNAPSTAYSYYLKTVNLYPEATDSYLALVELVNANVPVDEFQRGLVDYHAQAYIPAVAAFERYLTLTESITSTITATTRTANALWLMGLSQKSAGQYRDARLTFQRLIDNYPDNAQWGQAHLQIGETLDWQNNHNQAKTAYRQFAANNPTHPLAAEALWQAAYLELDDGLLAEASTNLRQLAETYSASPYADESLYWSARADFLLNRYEDAAKTWGDLAKRYPKSELASFGGYWQAKSLITLGRVAEARPILREVAKLPLNYYALRARDALAGVQPHSITLILPTTEQLATEQSEAEIWLKNWLVLSETVEIALPSDRLQKEPNFQRGQALLELGRRDKALIEFEKVKEEWASQPLEMYQLALYFQKQAMGQLSIQTAARLSFLSPVDSIEDAPIFIQRLFYPIYFSDILLAETKSQKIDPALALAIMRQESLFEQSANSIAGARGLMQVMPTTGEYIAQHNNFANFTTDQLWLPYLSIKFGVWYISQQLELFNNHQFAALAAYNAGPGNVQEWIKASDDLDVFVESIPFWESRTYIRNIYINLAAYRRLYGVKG